MCQCFCVCVCVSHFCLCVVSVYIQTQRVWGLPALSRGKRQRVSEREIKEYPTCRNNFLPAGQMVWEREREGKKTLAVESRAEVSGCSLHDFIPACITWGKKPQQKSWPCPFRSSFSVPLPFNPLSPPPSPSHSLSYILTTISNLNWENTTWRWECTTFCIYSMR